MLTVIDEHSRECLAITVDRRLNNRAVLDTLADLFFEHGPPEHIRSDNGPEFIAIAVRKLAGPYRRQNPVYRARITLGEWIQRELQR